MAAFDAQRGPSADCGPRRGLGRLALLVGLGIVGSSSRADDDVDVAEAHFRAGRYDACARLAKDEIEGGAWSERWSLLKIQAELARGKDAEALASLRNAERRLPWSLRLQLIGRDVYRYNGQDEAASAVLETIENRLLGQPQRYATAEARVALGRYFLLRGIDARRVLDQFYDAALKQQPELVEAHLATAELALEKQDDALAAETLRKAPKTSAEDPRYHYLLALAYSDGDRAASDRAIAEALKLNPSHAGSLLLRADHRIDDEKYEEAAKVLDQVLAVNPREARAWAYRAVLAHLRNDTEGETSAHRSALERWAKDPEVDHLIGRKLSQKYRFAEGAAAQRRALAVDPEFMPARVQLCQDLLRLGNEDQGWTLAAEIFARDAYNVVAYNLVTLHDRLSGFRTLRGDGFLVRMDPREADLYGPRVLALLSRAKTTLTGRYGVALVEPVVVEIFPRKKEFAVRTFGLPGADGFLGVCFGRVITANSPASQGESPSNWEAVLWHEFCHVVTLAKTRNKMPRWLSEGISVFEEEREDPSWKMALNPKFRAMLLADDLTPLSQLSSAFLAPKTPLHLQFAYYESALAVAFLVRTAGLPALKGLLDDLGAGIPINAALPRRARLTLVQLDRDFARFAKERARNTAPDATWEDPELPPDANSSAISAWLEQHPRSFPGLRQLAARLVVEQKWPEARTALEKLRRLDPEYVGPENAYMLLASVARRTSDPAGERKALEELAARDGSAISALLRLTEIEEAAQDWTPLARDARRLLAVNPLIPTPHRRSAIAWEHLGRRDEAIAAYRALALLDETDPAELHYRLARLLDDAGKPDEAKREVLKSLEDAPRFRDAHRLLLDLAGRARPSTPAGPPSRRR